MTRLALAPAVLALIALSLAGCTAGTATTHLEIRFAGQAPDVSADVASDLSSRPSQGSYDEARIAHADGYTAHDQLVDWAKAAGTTIAAQSFNGSFGSGFFLTAIDGVEADGTHAYWALSVNGQASEVGMSDVALKAGDTVAWTYTVSGAVAPDPDPIGVTVDPPAPTQTETATVTGSVNKDALVSIDGGPSMDVKAGRWSLVTQALDYGQTATKVHVDDGVHSVVVNVTLVRLAPVTIEVLYTAAVPPRASTTDTLWMDLDEFASAAAYADKPRPHPDFANVHDALVAWEVRTGNVVTYSYDEAFDFGVDKINGAGNALDAGEPPYWGYKVNGSAADFGITLMPLAPGDVVTWELGSGIV